MARFRRYRILIVVYSIGIFVGVREYSISQTRDQPVDFLTGEGSGFTDVMIGVNPGDPDTDFQKQTKRGFLSFLKKLFQPILNTMNCFYSSMHNIC